MNHPELNLPRRAGWLALGASSPPEPGAHRVRPTFRLPAATRIAGAALIVLASGLPLAFAAVTPPSGTLQTNDLMLHIRRLASDEFEGRAPATRGEELTVNYLVEQFRSFGLKPGHPSGSFFQEVPLLGITSEATIAFKTDAGPIAASIPGEAIATTLRFEPTLRITNSEMVFVGYGIVAPEYGWDDYKGVDVRGKTMVMLINDPPVPDPSDPARLDERMFKGRAMTYYGRWTYKYEIAAEKGAAAALIVHETGPAGYPYFVLVASHARENFDLQASDQNRGRVPIQGWLTESKARELLTRAGENFDKLKAAALKRDFSPKPLGVQATFELKNQLRPVTSRNVIAKLEGSDPKLRDEHVIYTAHWDHVGRNDKLPGDQIFNGALDNATGTAGLLELARAFARLKTPPKRTLLFLAVTAEEKGLLGAKYYAQHPLYPLERTVANLNMDGLNPWGRTRDIEIVGFGNSTLEDLLREAAASQGRTVTPDSGPEKGRFFRSDHFEFAKVGVPALYLKGGVELLNQPAGLGKQKMDEYTDRDYHKVTDEVKPDWDFSGGVEDLRLLFEVGWRAAQEDRWPEWNAGSEFKARREEMLRRRGAPAPR